MIWFGPSFSRSRSSWDGPGSQEAVAAFAPNLAEPLRVNDLGARIARLGLGLFSDDPYQTPTRNETRACGMDLELQRLVETQRPTDRSLVDRIDPRLLTALGAGCISFSSILMKLAETSAPTAGVFRCLLALPILLPLALAERRRLGRQGPRRQLVYVLAGVFLGVDLVLWGLCIGTLGAGIATVLVNVQVVIIPLLALMAYGERLTRRFALVVPVMLAGVALSAGVAGGVDAFAGSGSPWIGAMLGVSAGVASAGFLFLLRGRGRDAPIYRVHRVQPILAATVGATLACLVLGPFAGGVDLTPGWPAIGWLAALALSGQVCGALLIGMALPRLRSNVGAALLLLAPVLAILFGIVLLAERPSGWQLLGCAIVIATVWLVSGSRTEPTPSAPGLPHNRCAVVVALPLAATSLRPRR